MDWLSYNNVKVKSLVNLVVYSLNIIGYNIFRSFTSNGKNLILDDENVKLKKIAFSSIVLLAYTLYFFFNSVIYIN